MTEKPKVLWIIAAEEVKGTSTKSVDILGAHDKVVATSFPAHQAPMEVVVKLRGNPGQQFGVAVALQDASGKEIHRTEGERTGILGADGGGFFTIPMSNFVLPKPGKYSLVLVSGEDVMAKMEYFVAQG